MDNIELKLLKEEMMLREVMSGKTSEVLRCTECKSEDVWINMDNGLLCRSCGNVEIMESYIEEN